MSEIKQLRILDEDDNEITMDQVDLEVGKLVEEEIVVARHEAIEAVQEETHLWPYEVYFFASVDENGKQYTPDPVKDIPDGDERIVVDEDGNFSWHDQSVSVSGMGVKTYIDKEGVPARGAWDEKEIIQRYTLPSEEEMDAERERAERDRLFDEIRAYLLSEENRAASMSQVTDKMSYFNDTLDELTVCFAEMVGI